MENFHPFVLIPVERRQKSSTSPVETSPSPQRIPPFFHIIFPYGLLLRSHSPLSPGIHAHSPYKMEVTNHEIFLRKSSATGRHLHRLPSSISQKLHSRSGRAFCWRPAATSASPATTWRLASAPSSLPTSGRRALWCWAPGCLAKLSASCPMMSSPFRSENYMVHITCGPSEFNILGTDPEEFPELPTVEYQNSLSCRNPG